MRPNHRFTPQDSRPSQFSFGDSTPNLLYNRFLHHSYTSQSPPKMNPPISQTYNNKTSEYYIPEIQKDVSSRGMIFGDVLSPLELNYGKQKMEETFANRETDEECIVSHVVQSFTEDRRLETSKNCSISTEYQAPGMYSSRQGEQRFKLYAVIPDSRNSMVDTYARHWDNQFNPQYQNAPKRGEKDSSFIPWIIGALILLALGGIFAAFWINNDHQQQEISSIKIAQSIPNKKNSGGFTQNTYVSQVEPSMPATPVKPEQISVPVENQPQKLPVNYVSPTTLLLIPTNQIYRTAVSPTPESIDLQTVQGIPVKNEEKQNTKVGIEPISYNSVSIPSSSFTSPTPINPQTYTIYYPMTVPASVVSPAINPIVPPPAKHPQSSVSPVSVSVTTTDPAPLPQNPIPNSLPVSLAVESHHITSVSASV